MRIGLEKKTVEGSKPESGIFKSPMSNKVKFVFLLFASLYLAYHIFTLSSNPLPRVDEVFFASISKSLLEYGTFVPEICRETLNGEEVYLYGPIHFFLESFSFRIFGFGIFEYRWITFAFGITTILSTAVLFRLYHPSFKHYCLLILVFALDPFMNLSMHEGRMNLVAVSFVLIAIYFLIKGLRTERLYYFFISGMFAVFAILTTPQVGFIILPAMLVFLYLMEGKNLKQSLLSIILWSLPVIVLYSCWMFYAFGGVAGLLKYYQQAHGEYFGGEFYIPRQEYLVILLATVSMIIGIYKKGKSYFNSLVAISLLSIFLFYALVVDWGPHSTLILPFYYFLIFHGFAEEELSARRWSFYPLLLLFIFNLSYFSLKSLQILSETENRSTKVADAFIKMNIPEGSKVIGDGQYYYSVVKAKSSYRIFDQYLSIEARERLLKEMYDYDYLIVSDRSRVKDPETVKFFLANAELKKVAQLKLDQSELSQWIAELGLFSNVERHGYNAEIFVRVKKYKSPMAGLY